MTCRKLLSLVAVLSFLGGACGPSADRGEPAAGGGATATEPAPIESPTPAGQPGASPTPEEGEPGDEGGGGPAPGETTRVQFAREGRGTDPVAEDTEPTILVARTEEEGAAAANATRAPGAAQVLRGWDQYGKRALIVVLGGSQPDTGYRVSVDTADIIKDGTQLLVTGSIRRGKKPAAATISVPWVALSVDAPAAARVSGCTLSFAAQEPRTFDC